MRRLLLGTASILVGLIAVTSVPAPAIAATGVTINKITVAPLSPGATATIRPKVSIVGEVKITSKYFTIWNSRTDKRIVYRQTSARLGADDYTVKTTVIYKALKRSGGYYAPVTRTRTQDLKIATSTATCATPADADAVTTGDSRTTVAAKLHSTGTLDWSQTDDGVQHEHWRYRLCGSQTQWVWVSYDNNQATDIWIE